MKLRSIAPIVVAVAAGLLLSSPPAAGQGTELRIFVSNGVKAVVDDIRPQWEQAAGRKLTLEFGTTSSLKQRIGQGEAVDAAILTSEAVADLVKEGKLSAASRVDLARCGIGIGVRAGASKPDIHSSEALKRALHSASSITYAQDGASRQYIEKMVDRFGMTAELKPKTMLEQGSVRSNALVQNGKAQYVLTLVSEIMPAPGVELVGPLPADVQNYVNFAAGVGAKSSSAAAAQKALQFLKSSEAARVFQAKGLETR